MSKETGKNVLTTLSTGANCGAPTASSTINSSGDLTISERRSSPQPPPQVSPSKNANLSRTSTPPSTPPARRQQNFSSISRIRPHSMHSNRILVSESSIENDPSVASILQQQHGGIQKNIGRCDFPKSSSLTNSSSVTLPFAAGVGGPVSHHNCGIGGVPYRKSSYQPKSLSFRVSGGAEISNLLKMRSSVLGKSAPSLSVNVVSIHFFFLFC